MADPDETNDEPMIVSSSIRFGGATTDDAIRPTEIRHEVDEIKGDGGLLQRYNYIEYAFEMDGAFCRARSYIDTIGEVAFFGPFAGKYDLSPIEAEEFRTGVLDYLKRRFDRITEIGENGYVSTWTRPG